MPIATPAACPRRRTGRRSFAGSKMARPRSLKSCRTTCARTPVVVLDLSVGSRMLGADPANLETPRLSETISKAMTAAGAVVGVGRYDEARAIYSTDAFAAGGSPTAERRTVHLGIDLSLPPGSIVRAPLAGTVHIVARNDAPKDYGPLVILRHEIPSRRGVLHALRPSRSGFGRRARARKSPAGGRGVRRGRRAARERRLVAARPRPDHPRPPRPRRGLPRRRRGRPALALDRPLPGPEPDPGHPRRPLSRPRNRASRRRWPPAESSWATTSASPIASP